MSTGRSNEPYIRVLTSAGEALSDTRHYSSLASGVQLQCLHTQPPPAAVSCPSSEARGGLLEGWKWNDVELSFHHIYLFFIYYFLNKSLFHVTLFPDIFTGEPRGTSNHLHYTFRINILYIYQIVLFILLIFVVVLLHMWSFFWLGGLFTEQLIGSDGHCVWVSLPQPMPCMSSLPSSVLDSLHDYEALAIKYSKHVILGLEY